MNYQLKDEDLLDLWKYFQDRATSVKGAMFNTLTWVIGFAAILLGFIFTNLAKNEETKAPVTLETLMIFASLAGLALCLYAFFAICESAKHIQKNWVFADNCKDKISGLDKILKIDSDDGQKAAMPVWKRLGIIVGLFTSAFVVILGYAIFKVICA